MKKKQFSVLINAPRQKVWDVLWSDSTYRQWAAVFKEGSYAESDWKEGSSIRFLGPDKSGMNSLIAKNNANEFMSFKHLGVIKEGKEVPPDEKSKEWSGVMENYTLSENGNATDLKVDMDMSEAWEGYFDDTFPQALLKIKELAEME